MHADKTSRACNDHGFFWVSSLFNEQTNQIQLMHHPYSVDLPRPDHVEWLRNLREEIPWRQYF